MPNQFNGLQSTSNNPLWGNRMNTSNSLVWYAVCSIITVVQWATNAMDQTPGIPWSSCYIILYQSSCYLCYLCLRCSSLHSHGVSPIWPEPRSDFHLSRSSWHTLGASLWRRDSAGLKMGDIWPHRKMSILIQQFDDWEWDVGVPYFQTTQVVGYQYFNISN
jgi:hypothetical protein